VRGQCHRGHDMECTAAKLCAGGVRFHSAANHGTPTDGRGTRPPRCNGSNHEPAGENVRSLLCGVGANRGRGPRDCLGDQGCVSSSRDVCCVGTTIDEVPVSPAALAVDANIAPSGGIHPHRVARIPPSTYPCYALPGWCKRSDRDPPGYSPRWKMVAGVRLKPSSYAMDPPLCRGM
jgi:hypothetical protein